MLDRLSHRDESRIAVDVDRSLFFLFAAVSVALQSIAIYPALSPRLSRGSYVSQQWVASAFAS